MKKNAKRNPGIPPLPAKELRWRCDPERLSFDSTAEIEPVAGIIGQDTAVEALRFGLETNAPGQNIFVRGLSGSGRLTLVRRILHDNRLVHPDTKDCCYVYNFKQPDRPRLITLPRGRGSIFKQRINRLAAFIRTELEDALSSDSLQARRKKIEETAKKNLEEVVKPFEEALEKAGLRLVSFQTGQITRTAIFPVVDGQPVPPEEFEKLCAQGKVPQEHHEAYKAAHSSFEKQLEEINDQVNKLRNKHAETIQELVESSARWILSMTMRDIKAEFTSPAVDRFLDELVDDLIMHHLNPTGEEEQDFTRRYRVNLVLDREHEDSCPVIAERVPTTRNLLGTIDFEFNQHGEVRSNHMGICAGSLLRADGGYLIIEVLDLLGEPGAWKSLVRTLRTGQLDIVPAEMQNARGGPSLKPEPIPVDLKVVLLGDSGTYYMLDAQDPDFSQLFKVLADFDTVITRNDTGVDQYAGVLARIASEEQLPPFDKTAVAALAEHGARVASRNDKLTTRFSRIADIAREAAFISTGEKGQRVMGEHVRDAVARGKQRADLPSRKFRELVARGTIRVETSGKIMGQINGLAVLQAGPMIYGFPARITSTIGPGTAGVINIEREAALSGAIHTKGFYILGGLLRHLLKTDHPLAFDASVAFEQSYGGIDGDSASGAEMCCLLSALTGLPLRQDIAMTGAIDQVGHILAIGAANEKIEGFYDACEEIGATSTQGVIIPKANARDLMLRGDVVDACENGRFSIYAVDTIHEALGILTGIDAGMRGKDGRYPEGTVLAAALKRAKEYWEKVQYRGR